MNIDIHTAYRISYEKLSEFIAIAERSALNHLLSCIDDWMTWATAKEDIDALVKQEHDEIKKDCGGKLPLGVSTGEMARLEMRWRILEEKIIRDSIKSEFCVFYSNASFTFWLVFPFVYIIPQCKFKLLNDVPGWVEDYHYRDRISRPEHITAKQWIARRDKWRELLFTEWDCMPYKHILSEFTLERYSFRKEIKQHLGL